MESGLVTHLNPWGPTANPAAKYASKQGLARHLRHHRHAPRGNDADGDVGDQAMLHARQNYRKKKEE